MCRAPAGASSCTPCSPGSYSTSSGPRPRYPPHAWPAPAALLGGRECLALNHDSLLRVLARCVARHVSLVHVCPFSARVCARRFVRLDPWAGSVRAVQELRRLARAGSAWREPIRLDQVRLSSSAPRLMLRFLVLAPRPELSTSPHNLISVPSLFFLILWLLLYHSSPPPVYRIHRFFFILSIFLYLV